MGTSLYKQLVAQAKVLYAAEDVLASARLKELYACSELLRRTRTRAEDIVLEARMMLADAERQGDPERIVALSAQVDQARAAYDKVLDAYVTLCCRIHEEQKALLDEGLSGVA
ncbi:hypothetical protein ACIBEJ_17880 [Nonomuraea sp. NPDC050790]|uniref:hypothetical protein n=1 Tax=Nonomuraea sp. NPDC050790 TaxID=3364371 RepID=UPI0037A3117C